MVWQEQQQLHNKTQFLFDVKESLDHLERRELPCVVLMNGTIGGQITQLCFNLRRNRGLLHADSRNLNVKE
jgi:hypothetical protein